MFIHFLPNFKIKIIKLYLMIFQNIINKVVLKLICKLNFIKEIFQSSFWTSKMLKTNLTLKINFFLIVNDDFLAGNNEAI